MARGKTVTVDAFAKINLSLRVLGGREDGFHEVRTILQSIDLRDSLRCTPRSGGVRLQCRSAGIPRDRTNLVWQAAEAVWRMAGPGGDMPGMTFDLIKRIPSGAGLGGGSADAAAAIRALDRLWSLGLEEQEMARIGATLGSDVPFFLCGGAALGVGRGDQIYPLAELPPWWSLLVSPGFGVSTLAAYRWWAKDARGARAPRPAGEAGGSPELPPAPSWRRSWLGAGPALGNDLQGPVAHRHPLIAGLVEDLQRAGAMYAAMSGSGSTVFGLFADEPAARRARVGLRLPPGAAVTRARLLTRGALRQRARPRIRD